MNEILVIERDMEPCELWTLPEGLTREDLLKDWEQFIKDDETGDMVAEEFFKNRGLKRVDSFLVHMAKEGQLFEHKA